MRTLTVAVILLGGTASAAPKAKPTLEHGDATVSGDGVPTAQIGQPAVQGDLDKSLIRRYVKRDIQKLQYCYEKELLQTPTLKGTVTAEFTIGVDGVVSASTASGIGNTNVETCIADVIKAIAFPKPKGNGPVAVKYPFTFQPAEPPAGKK